MTRQQIADFLNKNKIHDFEFRVKKFLGDFESVVFDVGRAEITAPFYDGQSLEKFKQDVEESYRQSLKNELFLAEQKVFVLKKNLEEFTGIDWDH